ncbi:MAG TPA: erythromycin esterase family protein [Polyangiaceae bacterium]|nr:erythromycin esterase family protein [Polyangiaceae bacterium]
MAAPGNVAPPNGQLPRQQRDAAAPVPTSPSTNPPAEELARWLASTAVPLRSLTPGVPFDDLKPLSAMVGQATIVGLGEATHNSAELVTLRHRLFEYLVAVLGFDVFVMEVNWPEADRINDYVTRGVGDPEQLLAGLRFWTTDTLEVLELIRWMRRYNRDPKHARKLRFRGVDLQYTGLSGRAVQSYVERVEPAFAAELASGLRELSADDAISTYASLPLERQQRIREYLGEAEAHFEAKRREYEARSSRDDFLLARQHLRLLAQAQANYTDPSTRDTSMAANFAWVVERERAGSKLVLWAHDGHVSFERGTAPALGALLREKWGKQYFALGTFFLRGSFRAWDWTQGQTTARGVREFSVGTAPADTFESALAPGKPPFLLDLRSAPASIAAWLGQQQQTRTIGSAFRSEQAMLESLTPSKSYDAVVLLDEVKAAHPTKTGLRNPKPSP